MNAGYYFIYVLYFAGIVIILFSSFIINYFELFGLQQTYDNLRNKIHPNQKFKEQALYKIVRHPIYLGVIMFVWSTPVITFSHLALAVGFIAYAYIGMRFEERDLTETFGTQYEDYKKRVPKVIPFHKIK